MRPAKIEKFPEFNRKHTLIRRPFLLPKHNIHFHFFSRSSDQTFTVLERHFPRRYPAVRLQTVYRPSSGFSSRVINPPDSALLSYYANGNK